MSSAVSIVLDALERRGGRIGDFVAKVRKDEEKTEVISENVEVLQQCHRTNMRQLHY